MIRMRGYPQHAAQEGGEAGVWFPHPAVLGNIYFCDLPRPKYGMGCCRRLGPGPAGRPGRLLCLPRVVPVRAQGRGTCQSRRLEGTCRA